MKRHRPSLFVIIWLTIAVHLCLIGLWAIYEGAILKKSNKDSADIINVLLEKPAASISKSAPSTINTNKSLTTQEAPPAPSAEEWAFASKYSLKNSKAYRYNWGQQVRSMMGTAVEGKNQGQVRFLVEIAPNGSIAKVETLWKTSDIAEKLAYKAIKSMPPLPPTPNGKPLIFERTIAFSPIHVDGPPIYKDDCLPDPPAFKNPFAWDGKSPLVAAVNKPSEKPDPKAMAECLKQLPQDSIEAQAAEVQRKLDQWRSSKITENNK
jgi:hypothetical protein